jgi:histone H3/H4
MLQNSSSDASGFAEDILRLAVAQICKELQIEVVERDAFEILVNVLRGYVESIGMDIRTISEQGGRRRSSREDVLLVLEKQRRIRLVADLKRMCDEHGFDIEVIPPIPDFPLQPIRQSSTPAIVTVPNILQSSGPKFGTITAMVPSFLPAFPPEHTYMRTPIEPSKQSAREAREDDLKRRRLAQESLANISHQTTLAESTIRPRMEVFNRSAGFASSSSSSSSSSAI